VGRALSESLSCSFYDADDFHPISNIEKMKAGLPLMDEDRLPWLQRLYSVLAGHISQ
jgi:carbohydrate kinase (thermoresistant glucokinase family)